MTLANLLAIQRLQAFEASPQGVQRLLAAAERNLADAQLQALSAENRFDAAYKCILQCAMLGLWARGYRKRVHKQTDSVLFVKVQNDGFNLGARRRALVGSDLPEAIRLLRSWITAPQAFEGDGVMAQAVKRSRIGAGGDFNLSGERYVVASVATNVFPLASLRDICEINPESIDPAVVFGDSNFEYIDIAAVENVTGKFLGGTLTAGTEAPSRARRKVRHLDVLLSTVRPNLRAFSLLRNPPSNAVASTGFSVLRAKAEKVLPGYLIWLLRSDPCVATMIGMSGKGAYPSINSSDVEMLQIPLPPLEVQHQIVAEIDGYQKVIDGARQVLDSYQPRISTRPDWPAVSLQDICKLSSGGTPSKENAAYWEGSIPWVSAKDMKADRLFDALLHVSDAAIAESSTRLAQPGSLLILVRGMGLANGVPICEIAVPCAFNQDVKAIEPMAGVDASFLRLSLQQQAAKFATVMETAAHGTLKINTADLLKMQIPLPDLATQRTIVAEIEAEQALVNANRELIRRMEAKIKACIDRVWGGDAPPPPTPAAEATKLADQPAPPSEEIEALPCT